MKVKVIEMVGSLEERLIDFARDLVRIKSRTGEEGEVVKELPKK